MPSNSTYVCPQCRYVARHWGHCPSCRRELISMGTRWRPPKRNDLASWHKVDSGDRWWDTEALERSARNQAERRFLTFLAETNIKFNVRPLC